jgi:hypothetical protein
MRSRIRAGIASPTPAASRWSVSASRLTVVIGEPDPAVGRAASADHQHRAIRTRRADLAGGGTALSRSLRQPFDRRVEERLHDRAAHEAAGAAPEHGVGPRTGLPDVHRRVEPEQSGIDRLVQRDIVCCAVGCRLIAGRPLLSKPADRRDGAVQRPTAADRDDRGDQRHRGEGHADDDCRFHGASMAYPSGREGPLTGCGPVCPTA